MLLFLQVIICVGLVIVVGAKLSQSADVLAEKTGLGRNWVGTILLAGATSLPELVASLAAIRLNAVDLAVSNLFGSNLFNLAILGIYDLAYLPGNLLTYINQSVHLFTTTIAIMMTAIALLPQRL